MSSAEHAIRQKQDLPAWPVLKSVFHGVGNTPFAFVHLKGLFLSVSLDFVSPLSYNKWNLKPTVLHKDYIHHNRKNMGVYEWNTINNREEKLCGFKKIRVYKVTSTYV